MTRIVAGSARGRRLAAPPGRGTRPTADRVREALFSALDAARGGLDGARVLDLYAGSGAVGLEAVSRGAARAVLVESGRDAARTARANATELGFALDGRVRVIAEKVERLVAAPCPYGPFDIVFLDPPYALDDEAVGAVLGALARHAWLTDDALVVVERASRGGEFAWPAGFVGDRARAYGEAALWYGRAALDQR
jgi:16S rRNA (guanine966-N2)-methyltransferase